MDLVFGLKELIAAFVFLLTGGGIVGFVAHRTGNLHFGKKNDCPPEIRTVCKEHRDVIINMSSIIKDLAEIGVCVQTIKNTIEEAKDKIHEVHEKVNGIDKRLERHEGWHDGKK